VRRVNQFYLRLAIPRSIRRLFPSSTGKPRDFISEPLGRNYDPARVECDRRVSEYRALFARAALMTPKAVRDEIEAIKQRAEGRRMVSAKLPMLQSEIERWRREREEEEEENEKDFLDLQTNPQRGQERQELLEYMRAGVAEDVQSIVKDAPIAEGSPAWN